MFLVNGSIHHIERDFFWFVSVLDVDYAPTGKEFVSGSYDKSIRIFNVRKGHSRYDL